MKVLRAIADLASASPPLQRAFIKQINFLSRDLHHPSLKAKKYDEVSNEWQARVNDDWRFYFHIEKGAYHVIRMTPHPK